MNWGHMITISFVVFAAIIITMVTISMKQDVNLVAQDYYEEELAYQDQIDRINNFASLATKPTIIQTSGAINLTFPEELAQSMANGTIHLFRPSDSAVDQKHPLALDKTGNQVITLTNIQKGLWKLKLGWTTTSGLQYYHEQSVVF